MPPSDASSLGPQGSIGEASLNEWIRLGEEIGRGATGRVFKAEDLVSGQIVAVKKIPLRSASQHGNLQSVLGEIELLKTLNHKNIVQCLGSFRTNAHLYIMLEYMEQGSLASIIKQGVSLTEELASVYIAQVLQGLRYLHHQGVVHRDIKGGNILTNKQGVVKLADFGVAARLGELELNQELQQQVAGSPYWMAPEVIEMEQSITASSDIWSVGCLIIEALTGSPPYFDLQPMSALFRIVADEHPPLPPGTSPLMQSFLLQCFQKDPSKRPSAAQLLQHEWITEQRQTLRRTWRGFVPARSRTVNTVALESLNSVINQDLEGGKLDSPSESESNQTSLVPSQELEGAAESSAAAAGSAGFVQTLEGIRLSSGGLEAGGLPSLRAASNGGEAAAGAAAKPAVEPQAQSSSMQLLEDEALSEDPSSSSHAQSDWLSALPERTISQPTLPSPRPQLDAEERQSLQSSSGQEQSAWLAELPERATSQPAMSEFPCPSPRSPSQAEAAERQPPRPGSEAAEPAATTSNGAAPLLGSAMRQLSKSLASPTGRRKAPDPPAAGQSPHQLNLQRNSAPLASLQAAGGAAAAAAASRQRPRSRNPHARVYDALFKLADRNGDGRLTGPEAAPFFERSDLPREVLFQVWDLADSRKRGYLDNQAFYNAMDAIALAQMGYKLDQENWALVQSREEGFPLPQLRGFDEDGVPDGSEEIKLASDAGVTTAQFMSPPEFSSARSVVKAGSTSILGMARGKKKRVIKQVPFKICTSVMDGLKQIYNQKIHPISEPFKFSHFMSSAVNDSDFDAKPSVLLLGQYSTGKTSFIKHLLGREYPGANIGPEPTTDRFVVVHQGVEDRRTPGDALAVRKDLPYQGLVEFGTGLLTRLEGSQCFAPLLEEITLIDTPGLLSGEKQRKDHGYDFLNVCRWFANHSDLILLFFDPEKLDISDELNQVISAIGMHSDKICIVLNKASQVTPFQLMRVHGALMWGLGRSFHCPEMVRVCIGSFSNDEASIKARKNSPFLQSLFETDEQSLLRLLHECPKTSCDRKVSDFLKRLRACKVHLLLIDHLRKELTSPTILGLGAKRGMKKLMADLYVHFIQVQRQHRLPIGDFPDPHHWSQVLSTYDLLSFPRVTPAMIKQIDDALNVDCMNLIRQFENPYDHDKM